MKKKILTLCLAFTLILSTVTVDISTSTTLIGEDALAICCDKEDTV